MLLSRMESLSAHASVLVAACSIGCTDGTCDDALCCYTTAKYDGVCSCIAGTALLSTACSIGCTDGTCDDALCCYTTVKYDGVCSCIAGTALLSTACSIASRHKWQSSAISEDIHIVTVVSQNLSKCSEEAQPLKLCPGPTTS